MKEIRNAIIRHTTLGIEDHGIMTCMIDLDYEGGSQAFGGYSFDTYDNNKKDRVGVAFGIDFIMGILNTLEVGSWEKLVGTHCRVESDHYKVYKIGHIIKNIWFDPSLIVSKEGGNN